jgi:hypothetical protein
LAAARSNAEQAAALQARVWLERLVAQRYHLRARLLARSDELDRHRAVACDVAGQVLYDGINGESSEADTNPVARMDVRALLRTIANSGELA